MTNDLTDAAGAQHESLLYLAGGKRSAQSRVDDFVVYEPASDEWDDLADLPGTEREDVSLVAAGDYLYVFGGASSNPFIGNVSLAARYSPEKGEWSDSEVANLGAGRSGMAAAYYEGDIWLIGGFGPAGDSLDTVLIYDVDEDDYISGPSLPSARDHAGAVVVDGDLLVFGGRTRNGGTTEPTSVLRVTSPSDTTWSSFGDAMPRRRRSFVVGRAGGKVQLFGGESQGSDAIEAVDEFDPATGNWSTSLPAMPTGRHGAAGATVGASTFVVGGSTASGSSDLTDVNERFTR